MIELRPMIDSTVGAEIEKYRGRLADDSGVRMRTILEHSDRGTLPIGWCEWYPYDADPDAARVVGAAPGECGIDYAIGDPGALGRGLGTELIAALIAEVRHRYPGCGVIVDPDAANLGSRRVLERNGFSFVELRPWPEGGQMATYRLAPGEP
jgi:RimJ/RimL family protein N-acetyltransferase